MINLFWTRILIPKEEDELPSREQESEQKEETESNTSLGKKRTFFFNSLQSFDVFFVTFECNLKIDLKDGI